MRARIELPFDDRIKTLFAAEDKELSRGHYNITKEHNNTVFSVEADDAVALRTILGSITKILSVWERSKNI